MLDFAALLAQMEQQFDEAGPQGDRRSQALNKALNLWNDFAQRGDFSAVLNNATVPDHWHPAKLLNDATLDETHSVAPLLEPHTVCATDGSQIYPDPHELADCSLLHISHVVLRYAHASTQNNAILGATPHFFFGETDWPQAGAAREAVDARRHVYELKELARWLDEVSPLETAVGLCDGIFDLRVSAQQPWRTQALDENDEALTALRNSGHPVGGYIAASRATDVVTALRVVERESGHESEELARLFDVQLFDALLKIGQRSATWQSQRFVSNANTHNTNSNDGIRHTTCFFYLKIDDGNVARVEFPVWVSEVPGWLDRLHGVLRTQIERGGGYPVALIEAHEHAVVRAPEREAFYALLEELFTARGWSAKRSAKASSKRFPPV
jgi:hypothetical protein